MAFLNATYHLDLPSTGPNYDIREAFSVFKEKLTTQYNIYISIKNKEAIFVHEIFISMIKQRLCSGLNVLRRIVDERMVEKRGKDSLITFLA